MSVRVMGWVWEHSRAEAVDRLVLLAIADCANDRGEAWPSMAALVAKTHLSERTVQRAIRELVSLGELVTVTGGGRGRTNKYRLTLNPPGSEPRQPDPIPPTVDPDGTPSQKPRNPDARHRNPVTESVNPVSLSQNPDTVTPGTVKNHQEPSEEPSSSEPASRPDVEAVCLHLADWIERNGSKRPVITAAWRKAARLMLDRDGRTAEQVMRAIDWCQQDEFWRANVLGMPTLRKQYDRLRLAAQRGGGRASPDAPSTASQRAMKAIEAGRAAQATYDANRAKGIEA